jgi:hypothetical protein
VLLLLACASGPPDPRPGIAPRLPEGNPEVAEEALLRDDVPIACRAYSARARAGGEEEAWIGLLTAAARGGGCLAEPDGDAIAAWAAGEPARAERWRAARAEWLAKKDPAAAGQLLATAPGHGGAKLRVAIAAGRMDRDLAEAALLESPRDTLACWVVARAEVDEGDLFDAVEQAACGGARNARLSRVIGDALDAAGDTEGALAAYAEAGADVHRAAVLYQTGRVDEARPLLAGPGPVAALHRGWLALLAGEPVALEGLDDTPEARILVAVATRDPSGIADLDGPEAAVARKDLAALDAAIEKDPAFEPLYRARGARAAWSRVDPDHARLRGARGRRELPWEALVPGEAFPEPTGRDDVGDAWRAALALPDRTARLDAFAALQAAHPELDGLAGARYRVAAGLDADPARP